MKWLPKFLSPRQVPRKPALDSSYPSCSSKLAGLKDLHSIFTHIHRSNHWGDPESLSGPGSTLDYTRNIRAELPRLFRQLGTRVVLDAPCGDFNWFCHIPRVNDFHYIGGDIVEALVKANQEKYANSTTRFIQLNIVSSPLPNADFWLCRDCLFHLPTSDILAALNNFVRSNIPYLCTSHHPDCKINTDISAGDFRLINLELAPFNFGKAQTYIEDWIEGYPRRQLAIWSHEDVVNALQKVSHD